MSEAFDRAFEETIGLEGGYVNDPDDAGGETNFGISKRSYPDEVIAEMTIERAKEIYRRDFWDRLLLNDLHPHVAGEIFDTAVNTGPRTATKIAQRALRKVLNGYQFMHYVGVIKRHPERAKYARGWMKEFLLGGRKS